MRKKDVKCLFNVLFIVVVLLITFFLIRNTGNWLAYSDPIENIRPDYIFLFGGGGQHRLSYGFNLIKKYPQTNFFLSVYDSLYFSKVYKKQLENNNNIFFVEGLQNTIDEIEFIKENIVLQNKEKSIFLVSSPYHTRRIKILATRKGLLKNNNIFITHVPFESSPFSEKSFNYWYKYEKTRRMVSSELLKIVTMNFRGSSW